MTGKNRIKIDGGSICIFGDWNGRPYDNYYKISKCKITRRTINIYFKENVKLEIINYCGIKNSNEMFSIEKAEIIKIISNNSEIIYSRDNSSSAIIKEFNGEKIKFDNGYYSALVII